MTERCILCKQTTQITFRSYYCEDCWRSNSNDYLSDYHRNFNFINFYREYPDANPNPNSSSSTVNIEASIRDAQVRLNQLNIQARALNIQRRNGIEIDEDKYDKILENIIKKEDEIAELQREQQQAQIEISNR